GQVARLGQLLVEGPEREPPVRFLAVGETASHPIRLLGHAAPGEILVSPPVGRRLAGWCALQARELPVAADQPVQEDVYSVLGLVARRSPLAGLGARVLRRVVGRGRELAPLPRLLGRVPGGPGPGGGL